MRPWCLDRGQTDQLLWDGCCTLMSLVKLLTSRSYTVLALLSVVMHEMKLTHAFNSVIISVFQSRYQKFRFQTKWSVLNCFTHCCRVERSCRMLTTSSRRCQTSTPLHCCCSMVRQLVTWLRANGRRLRGYFRRPSTRWGDPVDFLS